MARNRKHRKTSRAGNRPTGGVKVVVDPLPASAGHCLQLGLELEHRREFDRARRAFARAVKLAPTDGAAHAHHAYALGRTLDLDGAARAHQQALRLSPDRGAVLARHGQMFMDNDMHEQAVVVLREALAADPNCMAAHMNLCWSLRRLGQLDAAIRHGERACAPGTDRDALYYLAFALLAADRPADSLAVCRRMVGQFPHDVAALSLMVSALDGCGERDAGRALADFDRLVLTAELRAPQGYDSLEAFNAELARLIVDAPRRPLDPTQTLDLFEQPEGALGTLWGVFNQAAQAYFSNLPLEQAHPFLAARPSRWVLDGWGNQVHGNPEQEHHFHYHGWLSGVYYVEVPPFVNADAADVDGCIEFCRFNGFSARPVESEFMVVRPQAGMLVLFPSYVYHRVCAYQGNERRISIAFNLTPTGW